MTSKGAMEYYQQFRTYEAKQLQDDPLLDKISPEALIAWFRCNSCTSCKWRQEVIDKDADPRHDIHFCSKMHEKVNIIDMVSYLGYTKEGRESDGRPRFREAEV